MYLAPEVSVRAERLQIADGDPGTFETLRVMRAMIDQYKVDPRIREAAMSVAFLTPAHDEIAEIEAIYSMVRDNVRYTKDIVGVETLATPDKTLALRYGDCDDMVVLLGSLLESVGYPTKMVVEAYDANGGYEHVYLLACLNGEWIPLDPTEMVAAGWQPPDPARRMIEP